MRCCELALRAQADAQRPRTRSTTLRELPDGGALATEYVLEGIQGDSAYALYLAASDYATPAPNTKARTCAGCCACHALTALLFVPRVRRGLR